ncbi:MAG: glycine oxidase ThiO [Methylotetracoccus sp.]
MSTVSRPAADVLVVGAGVIGLLTARELAAAGLHVVVLDKSAYGTESSWAGGGILSPLCPWHAPEPILALSRWSQREYPRLSAELHERAGIDPEWVRSGLLIWPGDEMTRAVDWLVREHVEYRALAASEIHAVEPHLSAVPGDALRIPGIAQVRNPRFLRALRASLSSMRVEILENHPVDELVVEGARVVGAVSGGERYRAGRVVLAAGAWSGTFGTRWLPKLDVAPVKGQMLALEAAPDLLTHIVLSGDRYLIPRRGGVLLAGSTVEHVGFDKSTSESACRELRAFAESMLPELAGAALLRHWAGLRPGSPNGIPFIGRHPTIECLYFNCGHFRNGFVMGPASARLLADLLLERSPIVPPEPYAYAASR